MSSSRILVLAAAAAALSGCSIVSPVPVIELVKATGAVAVSAISTGPSHSKNTVYHEHKALDAVCVEYNPLTPDPDIAPALQAELRNHEIDSRIYEAGAEAVADVAVDAWHGVEHLASEGLQDIEKGTGALEHLGSEAWNSVQSGAHRAREVAGDVGDGIKTAAGYVGDGIGDVADGVGNVAGRVASYATLGAAAIERAFSAVV